MKKNNWTKIGAYLSLTGLLYNCSSIPGVNRFMANDDGYRPQTAYEAWGVLNHSATSYAANALFVEEGKTVGNQSTGITFGAEKEASSSLLTRIMGPPSSILENQVKSLPEESRKTFLKDFLSNYVKDANGYRTYKDDFGNKVDLASDVVSPDGTARVIDLSEIKAINFESASLEELEAGFKKFLDQTGDRPMTFIKPQVRMKMFNGKLPGLTDNLLATQTNWRGKRAPDYTTWTPNYGHAEKYIVNAHAHGGGQGGGWEINFVPLDTYGEFEEMVSWFRNELKQVIKDPATLESKVKLFQAPGHQRMVFNRHPNLPEKKLAEMYRMIQTYIVIKGIQGNTGIEFANYKKIQDDAALASLDRRYERGVIRVEGDRWTPDKPKSTLGIEFRAGTKDLNTARFYQTALAARVASNDFSGMADIGDYNLYNSSLTTPQKLSERFGLPLETTKKAKQVLESAGIKDAYQIQLWDWAGKKVPFIGGTKKKVIRNLTKDYLIQIASLSEAELSGDALKQKVRNLGREWVLASRVPQDIEHYMRPKRGFTYNNDVLKYKPVPGRNYVSNPVDVNKIDLGIEYSGKFPLAVRGDFSKERLGDGKRAWIQTKVDLTMEEREAIIKSVAEDLRSELNGVEGPTKIDADGHGHGLDIAYTIRDKKNRKWIVEWDGIGRSYTPEGEIIADSPRGGSIELVTPKFTPELNEMNAVYKAFEKNNILPQLTTGGGHVNIDLAAFEGNPKALARFLTIFHEHRSMASLMFQHINRRHTSEQLDLSDNLVNKLKNFNGTEDDLKKLLYNERYFNTKFGRKTRYVQLDLSAYYQDVIPEEFITDDFDISNPTVDWRRTFRVDPKIRKAEFRMFNAPRDAMESALQVKFVRAMLNKALNETDPLSGKVSNYNHLDYVKNPSQAATDLEKMCADLGLDVNEYRPAVYEGLAESEKAARSPFFIDMKERLKNNPPQAGWGEAVAARSAENALNSEGREWVRGPADELNTMTNEHRIEAARQAQQMRQNIVPARELPGEFVRSESCAELIDAIL
ncbi:amidoligase family protein [Bacteriovorax sp. DB6_IX]|uniref:amidoligase family protein n=1 Tax=Bacteriovorax sp. DB6_IX TaxID=1353530 RepID=UPI00038A1AD1|nr:amidoligase family protein [Bacteriovorax sp. DB6_IX]EQC51334.1 hypothetical protein M901_1630 [Bacteriovorax sp. DB6_IX]